jgi:hypothetical protein
MKPERVQLNRDTPIRSKRLRFHSGIVPRKSLLLARIMPFPHNTGHSEHYSRFS